MNTEHPVVQKEGPVSMSFHESDSFLGHPILDMFVGNVRIVIEVFELPRRHVTARWARTGMMRHVDVKTMLQGRIRFCPEVPFAEMAGCVAMVFQHFRQREVLRVEPRDRREYGCFGIRRAGCPRRRLQDDGGQMTTWRGNAMPRGIQAGQHTGPRWRTEWTG